MHIFLGRYGHSRHVGCFDKGFRVISLCYGHDQSGYRLGSVYGGTGYLIGSIIFMTVTRRYNRFSVISLCYGHDQSRYRLGSLYCPTSHLIGSVTFMTVTRAKIQP